MKKGIKALAGTKKEPALLNARSRFNSMMQSKQLTTSSAQNQGFISTKFASSAHHGSPKTRLRKGEYDMAVLAHHQRKALANDPSR